MKGPWCVVGDLNVVARVEEKLYSSGFARTVSEELMEFMVDTELQDLRFYDDTYTWTNNHVHCKLDRCLVNEDWGQKFSQSYAYFRVQNVSDHKPCIVKLTSQLHKRGVPFRFKNIWKEHVDFLRVVEQIWRVNVRGYKMYQLVTKLKMLKVRLKKWKLEEFGDLRKARDQAWQALK